MTSEWTSWILCQRSYLLPTLPSNPLLSFLGLKSRRQQPHINAMAALVVNTTHQTQWNQTLNLLVANYSIIKTLGSNLKQTTNRSHLGDPKTSHDQFWTRPMPSVRWNSHGQTLNLPLPKIHRHQNQTWTRSKSERSFKPRHCQHGKNIQLPKINQII